MKFTTKLFFTFTMLLIVFTQITFSQNQYSKAQGRSGDGSGRNGDGSSGIGSISGVVVDKSTLQAVEYANLVVFRSKDSVMVGGAITNQKGVFTIEKIPFGNYYMVVSFIGYSSLKIPNITVNPKEIVKKMGQIKFSPSSNNLSEVTITAEKRMMEYSLDKKIVNVDKNLVSAGGSAVDVMQNIPAVTVDIDGNVSLRGSTNVNILIDGRPSSLSGMSRQAILEQIPASSIEAIEIITNPSAKYNPEGMSGIINIRLKKKTAQGLNGMASVSAGTNNRYNSSLNLNYSTEKFNVFASWDGRWNQGKGYGNTYRIATLRDTSSYSTQHSDMLRNMDNNTIKGGFDWYINPRNTLTLMGQYNTGGSERNQDLYSFTDDYLFAKQDDYKQHNKETESDNSNMFALNYKKTFAQRNRELTADFSYSTSKSTENTDMTLINYMLNYINVSANNPSLQKQYDNGNNWVGNAMINYVHPLSEKTKLEAGYQGIFRNVDNDFHLYKADSTNQYVNDINSANHFKYIENINAIYGTFSKEWESISMQIGMRFEQANTKADQLTQLQSFTNNYFSIYPSLHISKKLANKNELQLSYSRRVNRPDMHDLNPFKDYSNPLMIRYGNPYLKPEYINSFELGHSKYWNKTSFYTSVYYRQINDVIKRIAFLDTITGVSNMTSENLSKGISYGVDFILEQEILKWWRINASFSYFRSIIEGNSIDGNISTDNYSWTSKLNSTMNFGKSFSVQISANYRAPIITPQGKMFETYSADIAVKKDLFKEKFSISFRISDIFNTQIWKNESYGTGFYATMTNKRQSQAAFLTLSYKINGGLKPKVRKKTSENGNGGGADEGDL